MRERRFPVGKGASASVDEAPGVELPADRPSVGLGDSLPSEGVDDLIGSPNAGLFEGKPGSSMESPSFGEKCGLDFLGCC